MKYKTSDLSWAGGDGAKIIQKRTEKLTHYTKALPPEKWAAIEDFFHAITFCKMLADRRGVKLNVTKFIAEYRRQV
jgi:hypothetical protein